MKVLLTGYAGFLGRSLARALRSNGYVVRVVLHRRTVSRRDFAEEADEVLWGSLNDVEVVRRAVEGVQSVVHSAWKFSAQLDTRPTVNETATALLFDESIQADVERFLFISSVAVYGMQSKGNSIIDDLSPLASGADLAFIYPSEKISVEHALRSHETRGRIKLGILRPGPIFDEHKGPVKKIVRLGGHYVGMGFGNGRNHMPYIHAGDVAEAAVRWLKDGQNDAIFNVTPTICMRYKDWYVGWGKVHGTKIKPVFIRGSVLRLAAWAASLLKKMLGKSGKVDVRYAIASSTRDLIYHSTYAAKLLLWKPTATDKYLLVRK